MHSNIVAEIGSWLTDNEAKDVVNISVSDNELGVVIKGSQGLWWQRPDYQFLYDDAKAAGLLVAHLHYLEPGATLADDEAAAILAACGENVYPLGVWLELDDLGGVEAYNVGAWVAEVASQVESPARRVAVIATGDLHGQMGALPANVRRVVTVQGETPFLGAWAFGVPYDPAVILASELYELVSSRGINPFDDQVERLAPPKATETIGESSGATPTAPPDDSTVNNDSTTE